MTLLSDLIDEFGLEAVMEQYNYATDPQTLYNTRVKKLTAMEMVWQVSLRQRITKKGLQE